jgi:hypothetical protein
MSTELRTVVGLDSAGTADTEGDDRWTLLIAGDYAVDRDESPTADRTVSSALRDRIEAANRSVVNFEAPIPDGADPITKSGPIIENPAEAAQAVAETGFDVCTLANNHVRDFGPDGVEATVETLRTAGCETVGVGESHDAAFEALEIAPGDDSVALINVCEREFNIAGESSYGAAWLSDRRAREAIRTADREYDAVIVVAHGGTEYVPFPSPELQGALREFVDLGADIVVGHHPHVPQGWERYGDGAIFYSLGNFLFDRMADCENTSWGLALEIRFDGATPVAVELVPTDTIDGTVVELGRRRDRDDHIDYLHRLAELTADPERLERYWQEIAIQLFYERYSNWLHMGCGAGLARARAEPNDPSAQRPVWDPEARREQILALLTIVRTESHRWLMTTALSVLTGETEDRRTPMSREEAQLLLSRTER